MCHCISQLFFYPVLPETDTGSGPASWLSPVSRIRQPLPQWLPFTTIPWSNEDTYVHHSSWNRFTIAIATEDTRRWVTWWLGAPGEMANPQVKTHPSLSKTSLDFNFKRCCMPMPRIRSTLECFLVLSIFSVRDCTYILKQKVNSWADHSC